MSFGLTETGLNIKTIADIKSEIEDALRATFGPQINLQPESNFGQIVGIISERESLIWELLEDIYNSQYPASASGISLDNVLDLVGLIRLGALPSRIEGQVLFGSASIAIPAGTQFSVLDDSEKVFSTNTKVTLVAGTDEVQTISFSATPSGGSFKLNYDGEITAAILFSDGATELQTALRNLSNTSDTGITVSGNYSSGFVVTFSGDDGKQEQILLVEDSNTLTNGGSVTISITRTTPGVYQGQVNCTALSTGPVSVAKKALSVIDNPISGLTRVFNPAVAIVGFDLETDPEARIRRNQRLQISEAGPLEAIRNKVLKLNNDTTKTALDSVRAYENYTSEIDVRNIPPKSFQVFVLENGNPGAIAGTTTGTASNKLIDSGANFTAAMVNRKVRNKTDDTFAAINGFDSPTQLSLDTDIIVSGQKYIITEDDSRDQEVAQAIKDSKPAGIRPYGDIKKTVTDSENFDHEIRFSIPTIVNVYLEIDLIVDGNFPDEGITEIKNNIVEWGNDLGVGTDVIVSPQLISIIGQTVGITDIVIRIDTSPSPSFDDNIVIDDGSGGDVELSRWEIANITIAA
ncbi:hypothetical protein KAR91_51030 [Candidatus Pacearchaeota archaeon]|nr:hypothetical protein [Candidatus Pacearchaeota archaeon]